MNGLGRKIVRVSGCDPESYKVRVRFHGGSQKTISLRHIFGKPKGLAAEILRGSLFEKCFVESGALAWPNGFELCPDALWKWATEQKKRGTHAA